MKYSKAPTEVRRILEYVQDALSMRVEDEGIGISQEEHARIFEPFYRAANALNIEGRGAALSVIRKYASRPDEGGQHRG
jgi:two-component system sensor kinase FixL